MPLELTQDNLHDLDRGQQARGYIANSYAQFEHLLLDLIIRAKDLSEHADLKIPYRTDRRIAGVRSLFENSSPLQPYRDRLLNLVDRFEDFEKPRLLLVHGFCTVHITQENQMYFNFKQYRPTSSDATALEERTYSLKSLLAERNAFVEFAREALELFQNIHQRMGWEGLPPADPAR
jgi:hypothetical protein